MFSSTDLSRLCSESHRFLPACLFHEVRCVFLSLNLDDFEETIRNEPISWILSTIARWVLSGFSSRWKDLFHGLSIHSCKVEELCFPDWSEKRRRNQVNGAMVKLNCICWRSRNGCTIPARVRKLSLFCSILFCMWHEKLSSFLKAGQDALTICVLVSFQDYSLPLVLHFKAGTDEIYCWAQIYL